MSCQVRAWDSTTELVLSAPLHLDGFLHPMLIFVLSSSQVLNPLLGFSCYSSIPKSRGQSPSLPFSCDPPVSGSKRRALRPLLFFLFFLPFEISVFSLHIYSGNFYLREAAFPERVRDIEAGHFRLVPTDTFTFRLGLVQQSSVGKSTRSGFVCPSPEISHVLLKVISPPQD